MSRLDPASWWPDVLGLAGVAAILYGIAAWSRPAAWVVGGSLAIAIAFRGAGIEFPRRRRPAR